MVRKTSKLAIVLFTPLLLLAAQVCSQSVGGGIVGRVIDERGDSIHAALVQIVNTSTNQIRAVSTDSEGRYDARELPPGSYDVTISKGGFDIAKIANVRVGVNLIAHLTNVTLTVAPVGQELVEVKEIEFGMVELDSPTLSTAFTMREIRELPNLTRDPNNLALLAPGVLSVRTFSFASTLVPFAVNGSRGRDNNFIIDSVDNNEPLFGGAATQFTNTDAFADYRILTSQSKAEFGRNSGGVVNLITQREMNDWHGSAFWLAQRDSLNATNLVERVTGLHSPAPLNENVLGTTVGGPIKHDSTWFFASYQWDGARNDLSSLYPLAATLPTLNGLNALSKMPLTPTLNALLSNPTVSRLPLTNSPCVSFIAGLPASNPCTVSGPPNNGILVGGTPVEFGTYLAPETGAFEVKDHQATIRVDRRLTQRDDLSARYMFDDLKTPLSAGAMPIEVGFFDPGLLPDWRNQLAERVQNAGVFWTHAWPMALHELRVSGTRISSQSGALNVAESERETIPSVLVSDTFATNMASTGTPAGTSAFLSAFSAAGKQFTLGRDTRPARINSNLVQVQDNISVARNRHSLKLGVNLVRTLSNIRDNPSDLGQYFYLASSASGFQNFASNSPGFGLQQFTNFGGRGGEALALRQFSQHYFIEDDLRVTRALTLNVGLRYENFGQPINRIADLNPNFGQKLNRDNFDFGPRLGFALGLGPNTVVRGGYGLYHNSPVFNLALLAWQSGPGSPFVVGAPTNVYPQPPFNPADVLQPLTDCDSQSPAPGTAGPTFLDCSSQDSLARDLVQPRVHDFSLGIQRQLGNDLLVEVAYVGNSGQRLYQRVDTNPHSGWQIQTPCTSPPCATLLPRLNPNRGDITLVSSNARSNYHGLQLEATKRFIHPSLFSGLAFTAAYTWSHLIDNASEIFGPDVRRLRDFRFLRQNAAPVEVITPFPQDPNDVTHAERGNSSFDRRHRVALSFLWALPSPSSAVWKSTLGGWELSSIFAAQSGQPFSPLNSFGACMDASGDGVLTNDRPSIGNPNAPINTIGLVADPNCVSVEPSALSPTGYLDPAHSPIDPATAHFVQVPLGVKPGTAFQAGSESFLAGSAGRNILTGPGTVNLDLAIVKNFKLRERLTLQLRIEAYDILNHANSSYLLGNPYSTQLQTVPAIAFGTVQPAVTPARVSGAIPENSLDAFDPATGRSLFLSQAFMNTSSRRLQSSLKFIF